MSISKLLNATNELCHDMASLIFRPPVTHVYNPLIYARGNYDAYLKKYGRGQKQVVLLGMNPGPFGMAQTGVPFGDAEVVSSWMKITGAVGKPKKEHPKRPILGVECQRREVSGSRLYGAAQAHFKIPAAFFKHFFIANYCPLVFLEESGRNRTPDKLPREERRPLFESCDKHLLALVKALGARFVVGIGAFAATRAREALSADAKVTIAQILHPSPANPAANRGWAEKAIKQIKDAGICERLDC